MMPRISGALARIFDHHSEPLRLVRAQRGGEPLNADAADDRADQRAAAADDDPDDDLRGLRQSEDRRADEISPVGEQAAGKAGDARRRW